MGEAPKLPRDLTAAAPKELYESLASPNLTLRLLTLHEMIRRGEGILNDIEVAPNDGARAAYFLWVLERFGKRGAGLPAEKWFEALDHPDQALLAVHTIRTHAIRDRRTTNDLELARLGMKFKDARARRACAESLTALASSSSLRPLLGALAKCEPGDDHLRYALRVALRQSAQTLFDWEKAAEADPWTPAEADLLADVALACPTLAAAEFLIGHLPTLSGDAARLSLYVEHASRQAGDEVHVRQILETIREFENKDPRTTILLFRGFHLGVQKRGGQLPMDAAQYALTLSAQSFSSPRADVVQAGIELAAELKLVGNFDALAAFAKQEKQPEALRASALGALGAIDASKAVPILARQLNDHGGPLPLREKAAQVLAGLNRDDASLELAGALQAAPARLQTVIASAMAGNRAAAERLLKAVEDGKASARLLQERTVQTRLNESKPAKHAERIAALTKGLPSPDEKMLKLLVSRRDGFEKFKPDPILGKAVFTKHCGICHQIGNEGTKIGPQLDGIGGRGLERLLEDVLDPSRNVDAAMRQTTLTLKDGKSVTGLLLREEGQIVVMADDKGKEVRVPKDDIDEKRVSLLSPMPANLVDTITEKDFHDLMAYLLNQRSK